MLGWLCGKFPGWQTQKLVRILNHSIFETGLCHLVHTQTTAPVNLEMVTMTQLPTSVIRSNIRLGSGGQAFSANGSFH